MLIESRRSLNSYQDYHMLLLTIAGRSQEGGGRAATVGGAAGDADGQSAPHAARAAAAQCDGGGDGLLHVRVPARRRLREVLPGPSFAL